tara:strand:- start:3257 stop:4114 length:858 start_codon:yes stop_codon:yes gene_type:complete
LELTAHGEQEGPSQEGDVPRITDRVGLIVINALSNAASGQERSVPYGPEDRHWLDWYQPREASAEKVCVLFIYGGNWRSGSRGDYRFVADLLLSWGYQVVIPDYRLYPEVRFSDILGDAQIAAKRCVELLDSDTTLIVIGHSAGAQLGALLTLNQSLGVSDRISGFIGLAGPYDFYPFSRDEHWDLFAPEQHYPQSQAVNYVRADAAPLFLLHGRGDTTVRRGQSKSLTEKHRAAGGIADRVVYDQVGHVGLVLSFAPLLRSLPRNQAILADIDRFIRSCLGDQS